VARTAPTKAFLAREQHRVLLTIHALLMIFGLLVCAVLNRHYTPDRMWVHYVAIGWSVLFALHLWAFSRGTLATMGRKRH
jgi:hypothetical protein